MGLIDGQPRSATVKALNRSKVTVLIQECFNSLEDFNPQALMPLLKVLTARVREAFRLANLQNPYSINNHFIKIRAGLPTLTPPTR